MNTVKAVGPGAAADYGGKDNVFVVQYVEDSVYWRPSESSQHVEDRVHRHQELSLVIQATDDQEQGQWIRAIQKYLSLRAQLEEKVRHESEVAGCMSKVAAIDGDSRQSSSGSGSGGGGGGDCIGIDSGGPDSFDLRDQVWYHGVLARAKVNEWLTKKGDFLVRESAHNATKIVLSVFVNPDKKIKISHFPITEELGQYSFEGEAFDSIRALLDYHIATKDALTAKSKAVIIRAAKRTERPFTHDDVKQGKRLGKGNFGDVFMGTLEDGTLCALKTCKDTVPANPERFLEEADTLNQYQHPNIVQIYGVVKRAPVSRWPTLS